MHTFYSGYGSCSVPPSQHFHILQSISHLSVDRNENEKMWVLLIKIVVTKYPRDKWYQFNAGNILRIQQREGKTITGISPTVSKHPTLTLWVHCSLSLISNTKSARSLNTFNTTSALNTNIFITSAHTLYALTLWEHSVFSPSTPRVKSPLRLSNSNTLDAPSLHLSNTVSAVCPYTFNTVNLLSLQQ